MGVRSQSGDDRTASAGTKTDIARYPGGTRPSHREARARTLQHAMYTPGTRTLVRAHAHIYTHASTHALVHTCHHRPFTTFPPHIPTTALSMHPWRDPTSPNFPTTEGASCAVPAPHHISHTLAYTHLPNADTPIYTHTHTHTSRAPARLVIPGKGSTGVAHHATRRPPRATSPHPPCGDRRAWQGVAAPSRVGRWRKAQQHTRGTRRKDRKHFSPRTAPRSPDFPIAAEHGSARAAALESGEATPRGTTPTPASVTLSRR